MTTTSRLLIAEPPLQVLPSLAVAVGLNEAIFIQQVHYWLAVSSHNHDGRTWIYNTLEGWQKQFPFWSISTLRRTIDSLRKSGILLTGNYNQSAADRTLWYSLDYHALDSLNPSVEINKSSVQDEQMEMSKMDNPFVQNEQMLIGTETTPETTQRGGGVAPTERAASADNRGLSGPPIGQNQSLDADQETVKRLKTECGHDHNQAVKAAKRRAYTSEELDRLALWYQQKKAEKRLNAPGATLWANYTQHGDLPDDLPELPKEAPPPLTEEEKRARYLAEFNSKPVHASAYRSR